MSHRILRALAPALALTVLQGCAGYMHDEYAAAERDRIAQLRQRASFDLACPADQLRVVPLQSHPTWNSTGGRTGVDITESAGVTGCGHRGVYVLSTRNYTTWYLNASGGEGTALAAGSTPDQSGDEAPLARGR